MKLQMKRIAAAMLATGMLLCAMPMAAFATDTEITEEALVGCEKPTTDDKSYEMEEGSHYTDCSKSELTLKKCLKFDYTATSKSDIPYAACQFKLEATEANPNHMNAEKTYNGWTPKEGVFADGYVQDQTVTFTPNDSEATLSSDQKSACKDFSYDFQAMLDAGKYESGCVYCYKVTETGAMPTSYITKDNTTRYVDVYVGYKENKDHTEELAILKIISYRVYHNCFYKNNCFENCYKTTCLDLTKLITGNQCDKTKQFDFTVVIDTKVKEEGKDSPMAGYTMHLTSVAGSKTALGMTNGSGIMTVDNSGTAKQVGKMSNLDEVKICNIPLGSTYTVTEDKDGYTLTISTNNGAFIAPSYTNPTTKQVGVKAGIGDKACGTKLVFKNDKHGNIPTGVMLDVAPYALMVGLALAGLVAFTIRKRREQ